MRSEIVIAAVLGGGATYLIRYLPIWARERLAGHAAPPWLRRFLVGLGPAAIAALLVLSLGDLLPESTRGTSSWSWNSWGPMAIGALTVLAVLRLCRNPALATLAGALGYGLAHTVIGS